MSRTRVAISLLLFGIALVCFGGELRGLVPDAPITGTGTLQMVVFEETSVRKTLPQSQLNSMLSTDAGSLRAYVASKSGEFYLLDKDDDVAMMPAWVQQAKAIERASLPWAVVRRGNAVWSGPLPIAESEALRLAKRYGGDT